MSLRNGARRIHRHAPKGPCQTLCGVKCGVVTVVYADREDEVNCIQCRQGMTRKDDR